jgi:hypothetical protein
MSEETQGAAMAGPISLIATILSGFVVGFTYLLSLLFSVQRRASVTSPDSATAGGSGWVARPMRPPCAPPACLA